MESAIEARNLRKAYGEIEAVRDVSLSVAPGEVFCLLGPNGAGKTTTVEMLEGHRDPSAGTVAQRYADLLDGYVIDNADMSEVVSIDARVTLAQTLMTTIEDREALAKIVMDAAAVLRRRELRGLRHARRRTP